LPSLPSDGSHQEGLLELLERAAATFVKEAHRRPPGQVTLATTSIFRSLVLEAAVRDVGGKDQAFALLGESRMVARRNHHRAWRREMAELERLRRVLGQGGQDGQSGLGWRDGERRA
jgi:hypothetical protein